MISVLGTSRNHKETNVENKEPAEVRECTFPREIHELTMLRVQARCCDEGRGIPSSAISIRIRIALSFRRFRTSR
jgi:hypothetical protein